MKKQLLIIVFSIFFSCQLHAALRTASVSGLFSNTATWGGLSVPVAGDDIIINTGITLTLTANYATTGSLTIDGTGVVEMANFNLTVGSLTATGAASINNSGAGTERILTIGDATNTSYTGSFSNKIVLVKTGAGTLSLSTGTSTLLWIDVSGGTLNILSGSYTITSKNTNNQAVIAQSGATLNVSGGTINCTAASNRFVYGFNSGPGSGTISGGSITANELIVGWNSNVTLVISGGTHTFSTHVRHFDAGSGTLTLSGGSLTTPLIGNQTNGAGTDELTINLNAGSTLSTGSVIMIGTGPSGTHTTTLNLRGGTLNATASGNLINEPTGIGVGKFLTVNLLSNTTTINTNGFTANCLSPIIGSGGNLIKTGAGDLVFGVANTYTGTTTINNGSIKLGSSNVIPDASAVTITSPGVLDMNTFSETVGSLAGNGSADNLLGGGTPVLTVGTLGTSTTFSGIISNTTGSLSLRKVGSGTLTLSGNSTFTGDVNFPQNTGVNSGTLLLTSNNALGSTIKNINLPGDNTSVQTIQLSGGVSISANLSLKTAGRNGSSFLTNISGNNTWNGPIQIISAGGGYNIESQSGTLTIAGTMSNALTASRAYSFSGAGNTNVSGTIVDGVAFPLSISKTGTGTLTLLAANTYTGTTGITGGTLLLGAAGVIPDLSAVTVSSPGVLNTNSFSETVGSIAGDGSINNLTGAGTPTFTAGGNNTSTTFSGSISNTTGTLTFEKQGTGILTLSGVSTYTGNTLLNTGTLRIGIANALPLTTNLQLAGTSVLDINAFPLTVADIFSSVNTSTITDNSAGTTTTVVNITNQANTVNALVRDGATAKIAMRVRNTNAIFPIFALTNANTFSGGLTLANGAALGPGTRLRISSTITTVGTAGAIVSSPFGTGTIFIGEAATDKAGILFDTQANNSLANAIVFNTELGTDVPGIRFDNTGHTLSGTISSGTAADIRFANGAGGNASATLTGQLLGAFGLEISGNLTTITLNNSGTANSYAGATIIGTGSSLVLGRAAQIPDGSFVQVNGTLNMNSFSETVGSISSSGSINNLTGGGTPTLQFGGNNTSTTFSGVISNTTGTLSLIKEGTGSITLSGSNTYTGSTEVRSGGTLILSNVAALGTVAGGLDVKSGATLDLNGINYATAEPLTIVGTGVSAAGAMINSNATAATYAGAISLGSATTFTANNQITLTGNIGSNTSNLTKAGTSSLIFTSNTISLQDFTISAGTLVAGSSTINISRALTKAGAATFTPNTSTVLFVGTAAQTIPALSYFNLTLNNSTGATLAGDITASGLVTLSSGILTTTNAFSIDLGTLGTIAEVTPNAQAPTSYVTGAVRAQRTVLQNTPNTFGGIGLRVTETTVASNAYQIIRVTGTAGISTAAASGKSSIARYFSISPATNTGLNATLVLSYFNHELAGHTEANLCLYKSTDARVTWIPFFSRVIDATNNTLTQTGLTGFSFWTASDVFINPLPITLTEFKVNTTEANKVALDWTTSNETNNDFFTIEKSKDGVVWESVKQIKGAGNSTQSISYTQIDENPYSGLSYYRLKQTDYDGKFDYSSVFPVEINATNSFNCIIYPSPSSIDNLNVFITKANLGTYDVRITNALGTEFYNTLQEYESSNGFINLSNTFAVPTAGTYYLQINLNQSSVCRQKIIFE